MRQRRSDRGSVLMVMPVAVLIVLGLGAMAVDTAVVYLRQREALGLAFDAANDAAGAGLAIDAVRRGEVLALDHDRARAVAAGTVAAALDPDVRLLRVAVDGAEVTVELEVTVRRVFAPTFGPTTSTLRVVARAGGELRTAEAS